MMAKWVYAFEDGEIDIVLDVLKHGSECPSLLENKDPVKKLFDKMSARITNEKYIKHHVYIALSSMGSKKYNELKDNMSLRFDLNFTIYQLRALKKSFENILKDVGSPGTILISECEQLDRVFDCISLLKGKL
jgi:hypothetical protein